MKTLKESINEGIMDRKLIGTETSLCAAGLQLYWLFAQKHKKRIGDGLYSLKFIEDTWNKINTQSPDDLDTTAKKFVAEFEK